MIGNLIHVYLPSLLGSALILQGALLHTGHILGMEVLMDVMITNAHLMEGIIRSFLCFSHRQNCL
jgi:hypothetical protein